MDALLSHKLHCCLSRVLQHKKLLVKIPREFLFLHDVIRNSVALLIEDCTFLLVDGDLPCGLSIVCLGFILFRGGLVLKMGKGSGIFLED